MLKIFSFIKDHKFKFIGLLAAMLVMFALLTLLNENKEEVQTVFPTREEIKEVVEVSGFVEAAKSSDLSFEKSGTVQSVNVEVGDKVRQGQVLANLSGSDAYSSVQEAEAGVQSAKANLANVQSGATSYEIDVKQQNLDNAKLDLQNVENGLPDTYISINNTIRDIIYFKLSDFFTQSSGSYYITFSSCDDSLKTSIEQDRKTFDNVNVSDLDGAKVVIDDLNIFVNKINNLLTMSCVASDSSLSSKRSTVSSIKPQIQSMYSEISIDKTSLLSANNAVSRAEKDLSLIKSPVDNNKIAIAEASLNQAYARLSSARAQASKNVLYAPFAGVVTAVNIKKGEATSMSSIAISLISDSKYQIKSKVSESDIAKLKLNNNSTVSISAFPEAKFQAVLTQIDPASTNEGSIPRYGITLSFSEDYPDLKVGLTANAKIDTNIKENALVIPVDYVSLKNGGGLVKIKTASGTEEKIVEIGIRSEDGKVEVLSGLNEGDEILK